MLSIQSLIRLGLLISISGMMQSMCSGQTPVPSGMTYQGRITDASGNPVPDGTGYEIEVHLYNTPVDGPTQVLLWGTRYSGVNVKSGAFNLILGSGGAPIPGAATTELKTAFGGSAVFLGIRPTKNATGVTLPSPAEIIPRQQIYSTPYAFRADVVSANGVDSLAIKNQAVDLEELSTRVAEKLTPTGVVSPFVGTSAPQGWLLCDGSPISRQQYTALFAVMGSSHGSGDGSTTFNLPDYRGRFLRGVDGPDNDNADRDPDSQNRTAAATGGNTFGVGSVQADSLAAHRHFVAVDGPDVLFPDLSGKDQSIPRIRALGSPGLTNANFEYDLGGIEAEPDTGRTSNSGGSETRPKNSAVNFIIKY